MQHDQDAAGRLHGRNPGGAAPALQGRVLALRRQNEQRIIVERAGGFDAHLVVDRAKFLHHDGIGVTQPGLNAVRELFADDIGAGKPRQYRAVKPNERDRSFRSPNGP